MTTTCPCPFCPLLAINLHIDDVVIEFHKKESTRVATPIEYRSTEPLNDTTRVCLINVVGFAQTKSSMKMGQGHDFASDEAFFNVRRISKWKYVLSFHTKHKEEDATDPQ